MPAGWLAMKHAGRRSFCFYDSPTPSPARNGLASQSFWRLTLQMIRALPESAHSRMLVEPSGRTNWLDHAEVLCSLKSPILIRRSRAAAAPCRSRLVIPFHGKRQQLSLALAALGFYRHSRFR